MDLSLALYEEILTHVLAKEYLQIAFPDLKSTAKEIVELKSYQALLQIKSILENDRKSDAECFHAIERVVQTFENLGSGCEYRHDY